jgi:hypothetical protein
MEPADANPVSPITVASARSVLREHSGAPPLTSAYSSAGKTPPTLPQQAPVSATQDTDCSTTSAKPVPIGTSSRRDIA